MKCKVCGSKEIYNKFSLNDFDVLQCKKCNLAFLSQIPTKEELKELYSSNYYLERKEYYFKNIITNPESGKYNDNIKAFSSGLKKLNSLKPHKGKLLDIGCGLGVFLHMAKTDGWDTFGTDISPYAVSYAREKLGLEVYRSYSLGKAVLNSDSFDVVTLWDSLEHFPDPAAQFKKIYRILKNDGLVMLDIPNETALLRVISRFLYTATRGFFTYPVKKLYHQYHLFYFSQQAIETLLKAEGFEIVSIERKTIPVVKARGSYPEKGAVKLLSCLERLFGMEYELFVVAKKVIKSL